MSRFERLAIIVRTMPRLGIYNILRVIAYRIRIAAGWLPRAPLVHCPKADFFVGVNMKGVLVAPVDLMLFGWVPHPVEVLPRWHSNPLNSTDCINPNLDWPDALKALKGRDVKPFWELSRFDWLPQWALDARGGDNAALKRLNAWLTDWVHQNPPYLGINWSCGQEAAIRVMNLAMSQLIAWGQG